MTKQELLKAIRANWFRTDEDMVDFIFDALPELKEPPILPVIKCKECKYAIIVTNEIGKRHLVCNIQVPTLVEQEYYCARGERK